MDIETIKIQAEKAVRTKVAANEYHKEAAFILSDLGWQPPHDNQKPDLGVDCVIWCSGEPKVDRLTDEDHHEAYWAESLYAFGDEDKFIVLPV
jgi:hypothetical protein